MKSFRSSVKNSSKIENYKLIESQEDFMAYGKSVLKTHSSLVEQEYDDHSATSLLSKLYEDSGCDVDTAIKMLCEHIKPQQVKNKEIERAVVNILENLVEDPHDRSCFAKLRPYVEKDPVLVTEAVIHYSSKYVKSIDLRESFDKSEFTQPDKYDMSVMGEVDNIDSSKELVESIFSLVQLCSSNLSPAIESQREIFNLSENFKRATHFVFENYINEVSEYTKRKEYATQCFMAMLNDTSGGYDFGIGSRMVIQADLDMLVTLMMSYLNNFVDINKDMLMRYYRPDQLNDIKTLSKAYAVSSGTEELMALDIDKAYYEYSRVYAVMMKLIEYTSAVNPAKRAFVNKFITLVKMMADTLRTTIHILQQHRNSINGD